MKRSGAIIAVLSMAVASPLPAQPAGTTGLGEVVVTGNRMNARYAQQDRPVVGLRRRADAVVTQVAFSSDSRDAETRKREIHAMLATALDRAGAAGVDLVTGNVELSPVTKANYTDLPMFSAGRIDTSKVDVMVRTRLTGSIAEADAKLKAFVKAVPKSGRGAIDGGGLTLTIIGPDQYRGDIVKLVADDARQQAAVFGPDYAVSVSGIDGQVAWSQVSGTDVFLYIPYRYTIGPTR